MQLKIFHFNMRIQIVKYYNICFESFFRNRAFKFQQ